MKLSLTRSVGLLLISLAVLLGFVSSGRAAGALVWSGPVPLDHQPPYANPIALDAVSCPTVSLCVAADVNGTIFASVDPTGDFGSWLPAAVDGSVALRGISCPSAALCVAVGGSDAVVSEDPTGGASSWQVASIDPTGGLSAISCASSSLCVAVDGSGHLVVSTDPTGGADAWTVQDVAPGRAATGVACPSASLCVAVDGAGDVITSTDPAGGADSWQLGYLDPATNTVASGFTSVACPSTSLCVAGDAAGNVFFTGDPAGGAGTWGASHVDSAQMQCGMSKYAPIYCQATIAGVDCPSASACLAIDGAGNVLSSSAPGHGASAWGTTGTVDASSLACPSMTLCVAPGDGVMISSADPLGDPATWTPTAVLDGTPQLSAVSCSSAMCAVGDASGHVLTWLPGATPAAWSSTYVGPWGFEDLSCPSPSFCAGVSFSGEVMASDDPSAADPTWVDTDIGLAGLFTISCPSASLCVASDHRGDIATSTDPTGGAVAWTVRTDGFGETPTDLSCPSVSLCLMSLDGGGQLASTTDPTGPTAAWRLASVDGANNTGVGTAAMLGVSCPTVSLCVASDNAGHVVVSTDPRNPRARWTSHDAYKNYAIGHVDCPTVTLCVGYNAFQLMTTTDPTGPGGWQLSQIGSGGANWIYGLSCPSSSLCLAVSGANAFAGTPAPPPSSAQIAASMRRQLIPAARARKIEALLRARGVTTPATSLAAGTWRVSWYASKRSIASGTTRFPAAGTTTLKLELTNAGQRLLARSHRLRVRAIGTFTTATHTTKTTVTSSFTLHRP
jgi:hypothetical protein